MAQINVTDVGFVPTSDARNFEVISFSLAGDDYMKFLCSVVDYRRKHGLSTVWRKRDCRRIYRDFILASCSGGLQ